MSEPGPPRDREEAEQGERAAFTGTLRTRRSRAAIVVLLVSVVVACGAVVYRGSQTRKTAEPAASSAPPAERLAAEACAKLAAEYRRHVDEARACERDEDCVTQERGGLQAELDGCARFVARSPRPQTLSRADEVAGRWLRGGCPHSVRACLLPLGRPICDAHKCVESPPAGRPRSWRRLEVPGVLTFFAPAEIRRKLPDPTGVDSWVPRFGGDDVDEHDVSFDIGAGDERAPDAAIPPHAGNGVVVRSETLRVGDSPGRLDLVRDDDAPAARRFALFFWAPHVPSTIDMPRRGGHPVYVSIHFAAPTRGECEAVAEMLRTIEPWSG